MIYFYQRAVIGESQAKCLIIRYLACLLIVNCQPKNHLFIDIYKKFCYNQYNKKITKGGIIV